MVVTYVGSVGLRHSRNVGRLDASRLAAADGLEAVRGDFVREVVNRGLELGSGEVEWQRRDHALDGGSRGHIGGLLLALESSDEDDECSCGVRCQRGRVALSRCSRAVYERPA